MPRMQQTQIRFHMPGRLRIALPSIKRNEARARLAEHYLRALDGVQTVHANPLTGNLLVRFDPRVMGTDRIVDALEVRGFVGADMTPHAVVGMLGEVSVSRLEPFADALVGMALEAIVRHCALALITTLG
jgi:copper chaperone CopZ